ncbi:MAG: hypothetical protein F6K10_13790 [Moorea sp. SIO2B7]|nr:hypothetical protein [Moorena sp. SIO2B7]
MGVECTPVAFFDFLTLPSAPYRIPIPRTRDEMRWSIWSGWLHCNDRFQYSYSPDKRFTARKALTGQWFAHRMLNRRIRTDPLGFSSELTGELLEQAAINISLSDDEYWVDCARHQLIKCPYCSKDLMNEN